MSKKRDVFIMVVVEVSKHIFKILKKYQGSGLEKKLIWSSEVYIIQSIEEFPINKNNEYRISANYSDFVGKFKMSVELK